jgi:NADH-quinone oxidoreductase subunit M
MLFTMGNVGLPGTSGFIGEITTMTGAYHVSTWTAVVAASGVIFSAVYALSLYRRVVFGELTNPKLADITDLDWREVAIFTPLIAMTLYLGVYPAAVFDLTQASVDSLAAAYQAAIGG